jgi:iron complex outermembrane receptor protein
MIGTINDWDQDQFSQEIQLSGTNFSDQVHWVLGGYYSEEDGHHNDFGMIWSSNLLFKSGADINASSLAFFGQAVIGLTERLTLTVGTRWTRDRKTFDADQYIVVDNVIGFPPGTPLIPMESLTIEDHAMTPAVSLSYALNNSLNIYASYSEGFKGGGFTQRNFPPLPVIPSFEPEEAKAYEVGAKFQGFDDRVRFNFAAFHTDYEDMQLLGQEPTLGFAPIIFNAAKSTVQGFEMELSAVPASDWLLQGGFGFLDAEYDEVSEFAQAVGVDTSKEFMNAPKVTASMGLSYEYRHSSLGSFTPRFDWSYTSKIYNDVTNAEVIAQEAYHLFNVSLAWESRDGLWSASVAGLNLTDEEYKDSGNFDPGGGIAEVVFTRGREVRLSIRRNF